jgi:phosphoribosylglycinamide formyltransferase 1
MADNSAGTKLAGRSPLRIGVLGSGRGSNCQSIIDAIQAGHLNAKVVCVLSDVANAYILDRARKHGIHAQFVSAAPFKTKLDGDAEKKFVEILRHHGADVIVLAGFMRVVKKGLLDAFPGKVINIHPSLLPAFPGLEAWKQALEYGAKVAGCTVHIVDAGVDTGPIIVQKSVPVLSDDTPEALHARIQEQEHIAYPEALAMIGAGSLRRDGRRIVIRCPA